MTFDSIAGARRPFSRARGRLRRARLAGSLLLGLGLGIAGAPSAPFERRALAAVPSAPGDVVVTWSDVKQKISGFGAAAVFFAPDMSPEDSDFLFSASRGLGLSLLRVSIGLDATCPEIETAKKAQYYGVKVWAASWTPPIDWKSNMMANAMPKAYLLPEHYVDFANHIASYIDWMAARGIPLYAVSPQNEPDWEASWDGCLWSAAQMTTFIRDNLGPTLATRAPNTLIMAPDTASLSKLDPYVTALMNDSRAKGYTSIIATHPYGGTAANLTYSKPRDNGKEYWETEVSQEKMPTDVADPSITSALTMVAMMHDHLITSQMNAWHWWALIGPEVLDDVARQNPALIQNGVKFKRAYALGNFAKFIRPGFVRLGTTEAPATGIRVSGYKDPSSNRVSIVAVNSGTSARTQKFWVDGSTIGTITPYVTSADDSLAKKTALPAATNNFSFSLPARSITTFVNWNADDQPGPATPPPPTPKPDGGVDADTTTGPDGATAGGTGGIATAGSGGRTGAGGAVTTGAGGSTTGAGGAVVATGTGGSTTGAGGAVVATGTGGSGTGGAATTGAGGAKAGGTGGTGNPQTGDSPAGCACSVGDRGAPAGSVLAIVSLLGLTLSRRRRR